MLQAGDAAGAPQPQVLTDIRQVRSKLQANLQDQIAALSETILGDFECQVGALCNRLIAAKYVDAVNGGPAAASKEGEGGDLPQEVPLSPIPPFRSESFRRADVAGTNGFLCGEGFGLLPVKLGVERKVDEAAEGGELLECNLALEERGVSFTRSGLAEETLVTPRSGHHAEAMDTSQGRDSSKESGPRKWNRMTFRMSSESGDGGMGSALFLDPVANFRERCKKFIESWKYETLSSSLIMLNCITMGVQAHRTVAPEVDPAIGIICDFSEHVFTALFTLECLIVFCVLGREAFSYKTNKGLINIADAALVFFTGILVTWLIPFILWIAGTSLSSPHLNMLMLLRVVRLARLVRVFQRFPLFREAWLLIRGLMDSARTLVWTVIVIFFVTYVFAVIGLVLLVPPLQDALPVVSEERRRTLEEVVVVMSGLDAMMFTLVQVLMGDSFHTIMREVLLYVPWSWLYFYAYISVASIVLLNLVTAIIVENARENSENDHAHQIREKEAEKKRSLKKLKRLFKIMDADRSGSISKDEFRSSFQDPTSLEHWSLLNFGMDDCEEVWHLIDDGDGVIEIDEFIDAVSKMQGVAQSKDLFRISRAQQKENMILRKLADSAGIQMEADASLHVGTKMVGSSSTLLEEDDD